jgi:hypothetical protein
VTEKRFKRYVGACIVQILCGLVLALIDTAGQGLHHSKGRNPKRGTGISVSE